MARELSLPYVASGEPVGALAPVAQDHLLGVVAIHVDGHNLSINYHDLLPGDVFLFGEAKFDPLFRGLIPTYQRLVLAGEAAASRWQHVGLLDRNFLVWDAMPDAHVRSRALREVLAEPARICVFRPNRRVDPDFLAETLLEFSNGRYKLFRIDTGGALLQRLVKRPDARKRSGLLQRVLDYVGVMRPQAQPGADLICSLFVTGVLRRATGYLFFERLPISIPGDFAVDPDFIPVDLEWRRLSP